MPLDGRDTRAQLRSNPSFKGGGELAVFQFDAAQTLPHR